MNDAAADLEPVPAASPLRSEWLKHELAQLSVDEQIDVALALAPAALAAIAAAVRPATEASAMPDLLPEKTSAVASERRRRRRLRTLKSAKMSRGELHSLVDCDIRDLSENGCRIVVENPFHVPDEFELIIGATGDRRTVRVIWRRSKELGLAYV